MTTDSTNSGSNLIDPDKILSHELSDLGLDEDFRELHNLAGYDMDIMDAALNFNSGQTEYQSQAFVANSQLTPWRKVRQALLELETRYHAYYEVKTSLRKAEVYRKQYIRGIENEPDELTRELMQIDMDKNDYDITIWRRKLRQATLEIESFLNVVKSYANNVEELKHYTEYNQEEERKYWITRLGKQAALDVIAYGRVGSGNMDSIAMMPQEDQEQTLGLAVRYSGIINANLHQISEQAKDEVNTYLGTDKVNVPLIDELNNEQNLQLTAQPKVGSETI